MHHAPQGQIQFHYWNRDYLKWVDLHLTQVEEEIVFFRAVSHQLYGTPNNHFYILFLYILYTWNSVSSAKSRDVYRKQY